MADHVEYRNSTFRCCQSHDRHADYSRLAWRGGTVSCGHEGCQHNPFWCKDCRIFDPENLGRGADLLIHMHRGPTAACLFCKHCALNRLSPCNGESRIRCDACVIDGENSCQWWPIGPLPPPIRCNPRNGYWNRILPYPAILPSINYPTIPPGMNYRDLLASRYPPTTPPSNPPTASTSNLSAVVPSNPPSASTNNPGTGGAGTSVNNQAPIQDPVDEEQENRKRKADYRATPDSERSESEQPERKRIKQEDVGEEAHGHRKTQKGRLRSLWSWLSG